jgi:hypothetical protein
MVVNVWLMCLEYPASSKSLLAVGDNASGIGWLFRSSRIDQKSLYYYGLAMMVTDSEHCLASQHIKGETNLVANLLSWSCDARGAPHPLALDDPSNKELTLRFHSHLPQLIPKSLDVSATQRRFILDHAGFANRRIVLDSKQEAGHKIDDQVWRRWKSYCALAGIADDPFLVALKYESKRLLPFAPSLSYVARPYKWSLTGRLEGRHKQPLVTGTIRTAASCLAALFWHDFKPSPIHIKGGLDYHPGIKALFKAFDNMDPPTCRQKVITPKLLRKLLKASHHSALLDTMPAVVANLVIGAFFFAKHAKPRTAGQNKVCQP